MKFYHFILFCLCLLTGTLHAEGSAAAVNDCSLTSQTLSLVAVFLLLVAVASLERARRFKHQAKQASSGLEQAQQGLEQAQKDVKNDAEKIRELEEKVAESKELAMTKARFLATMSHEIRTPLNAIIGFADFLDQPDVPPDKQREYARSLSTVANALLSLINDILDLSKLDSGNTDTVSLQQGATEFPRLFEEMQTIFQLKAAQKGLALTFDVDKSIPCLTILEPRVRQILLNVIGNAIKYTLKGSVAVSCSASPNAEQGFMDVLIVVKDTGIGISPTGLKTLFDPFSQDIESRQGKVFQGTGLGLSIVKRLMEASGGDITVESSLGQGSTFTLTFNHLAIREAMSSSETSVSHTKASHAIRKVIIVDDISMNRKILGMYLKTLGISNAPDFASAKEALHYLTYNTADVILSDMWMPEMNGAEFAKEVKRLYPEIPVVAVTADVDVGASFDTAVFTAVITKPVTAVKLKELLSKLGGVESA